MLENQTGQRSCQVHGSLFETFAYWFRPSGCRHEFFVIMSSFGPWLFLLVQERDAPSELLAKRAPASEQNTARSSGGSVLLCVRSQSPLPIGPPFGPSHLSTNCPELDQVALATVDALSRPACFLFIYLLIRSTQSHPFFPFFLSSFILVPFSPLWDV